MIRIGRPIEASWGIEKLLGIDQQRKGQIYSEGLNAIRNEFQALNGNSAAHDIVCMRYVLDQQAVEQQEVANDGHSYITRDAGHLGLRLADFCNHQNARIADLSECEVAALRLYTSNAYPRINDPLRQRVRPHPLAATVLFLTDALRKLRSVEAERQGNPAFASSREQIFWRGMKNLKLTDEFKQQGGAELGCMSTSTSQEVVASYAKSQQPLIFRITAEDFMSCGADISWLSMYPSEAEILYPPLTYLRFTKMVPIKNSSGWVVDVKASF